MEPIVQALVDQGLDPEALQWEVATFASNAGPHSKPYSKVTVDGYETAVRLYEAIEAAGLSAGFRPIVPDTFVRPQDPALQVTTAQETQPRKFIPPLGALLHVMNPAAGHVTDLPRRSVDTEHGYTNLP